MSRGNVWMTMLIKGDIERLAGRLVSAGYCVEPLAFSRKLEHVLSGVCGSVAAFSISHPDVKSDVSEETNKKTVPQKFMSVIRGERNMA